MCDEELKQNVSDEVLGVVENMWSAVKNMEGEPKVCRAAIGAIYYAVFHSAKALLFGCGIETESHEDVQRQFALHFGKPGIFPRNASKVISALMTDRHNADYKLYIPLDAADVAEDAKKAVEHLARFAEVMRENGFATVLEEREFDAAFARFCRLADD